MELLAPAGNVENFLAAVEAGADAVYVGAPGFNARNLARDLRLEEIGAMIRYCRAHGKKLYVAANSLLLEKELPEVIETLALLEILAPDALIVQDLGLINLVRRHFPRLKLHASTLMAAHNVQSVELFSRLGCERVVLARELTLDEIREICQKSDVDIEVFVHGAMCFSYSGLCLFSSFLGGKSGLRGRCVQPCRRAYTTSTAGRKGGTRSTGGKGSYLFSMNDLDGLQVVRFLQEAGVTSLKIEGRLRSAHYVETVVRAYRLVMDAAPADYDTAVGEAQVVLEQAMSRKVSSGYFFNAQPAEAITPHHSGNLGLHLGRAELVKSRRQEHGLEQYLRLDLKENLMTGDRVRLHLEPSGERFAYTLKSLIARGQVQDRVLAGVAAEIPLPRDAAGKKWKYIDVYKVDIARKESTKEHFDLQIGKVKKDLVQARKKISRLVQSVKWQAWESSIQKDIQPRQERGKGRVALGRGGPRSKGGATAKVPIEWWLKTDSTKVIEHKLPVSPDRFVVSMDRHTTSQAGQIKRVLGKRMRIVTWALPPIILDRDLKKYKKQITMMIRSGFRSFQIGHVSQVDLFEGERVFLSADYTLNILNNQSVLMAGQAGLEAVQLAIESDRENLQQLIQGYKQFGTSAAAKDGSRRQVRLGLTVYGAPALYTSRIAAPFFQYDRPVVSPKNESFVIRKKDGYTQTYPLRPFSLLPYLSELKSMGLDYVVVDVSGGHGGKKEMLELAERMAGKGGRIKLPTFNYLGRLE